MICSGCVAFSASIVEGPTAAPGLGDIPIVCEFPDVFLSELTCMPPVGELKAQLQYSMDRGFCQTKCVAFRGVGAIREVEG